MAPALRAQRLVEIGEFHPGRAPRPGCAHLGHPMPTKYGCDSSDLNRCCRDGRSRSSSWSGPSLNTSGAAIGVFLFDTTEPATVAWLRAAAAAVALLAWRRPWRRRWSRRQAGVALMFGLVTIGMNIAIYEAISRIPLGTAVAIEFLGPTAVAALGSRRRRDFAAVGLACVGVLLLAGVEFDANLTGVLFALVSAAMWAGYILLGKRVADTGDGLDSLAVGMSLAAVILAPAILIPQARHRRVGFRRFPDMAARSLHRAAVHRDPLRARPTRLRPDRQREVRVAAGAPTGDGDADRHRGAATNSDDPGNHSASRSSSWRCCCPPEDRLTRSPRLLRSRSGARRWHPGGVGLLIVRLVELLIVIVPLIGLVYGGFKAVSKVRDRADDVPAVGGAPQAQRTSTSAQRRAIERTVREHDRTDTRWLDYEMDVSKLLDYPLMTDMRDPFTQRFHRAKLRADLLRPAEPGDLLDDSAAARDYRDAVEEYVTAFEVAEAEAIRKRRNDFSRDAAAASLPRAQRAADRDGHRGHPAGTGTRLRCCPTRTRRPDRAAGAHPRRDRARNRR